MEKFDKILKSFKIRETLNPDVWENSETTKKSVLKKSIRDALLNIAEKFIDYLDEEIFIDDIILTGSLANFTWSEFSDFDLHVVIDFEQFDDEKDLYKQLYNLKRQIFNDKHDIKIKGYDVELYPQDSEEEHFGTGIYSIKDNEWLILPKKEKIQIDKKLLAKKIMTWKEKIDSAIKESDSDKLEKIKTKLLEYRKCGLNKSGEFSYENLVFKFLRRSKYIEKLLDTMNNSLDKELSIENRIDEQLDKDILSTIKKLFSNLFSSEDKKSDNEILSTDRFTYLDLNSPEGYEIYKEIADNFIKKRNPNAGVTGKMLADSAKKYFSQGYVPPELSLAQLALEGGLSKNENNRPRKTKNPYNVGNVDSGKNKFHSSVESGVDSYYQLMTSRYLTKGKKADDLLDNFVNFNGNRYATSTTYEEKLSDIIKGIKVMSEPILAKHDVNKKSEV